MRTFKSIIVELAERYGVVIADRSATGSHIWDGETIADHYHSGYDGSKKDFDKEFLCHELAHWIIAPEEQRKLPEYGYPSLFDFDLKKVKQIVPFDLMDRQEKWALKKGYNIWLKCYNDYNFSRKLEEV